jgi:two-component system phosphate regulon sensor histidine kinase PhoR
MHRRRYWLWIAVFVGGALLLGTLATGWNFVLMRDYERMVELARSISQPEPPVPVTTLVLSLVLGTFGFFLVLSAFIVFFLRLLREMRQNQQQSEFLATVTHELKTPISAIELSSSLLRTENLTLEERDKLWNSHQAELSRLKTDVESLLQAARWESMPIHVNREPVDLETWVRESMDRWNVILGPGAQLKRSGPPLEVTSALDLRKLNLISDNILQNARKYAKDAPKVEVHTERRRSRWQIQFRDDGWGFDPKESKNLLKPFYRSRTYSSHAIPGAGLGLYIAHSASRALGMKIKGFSLGRGQGAVFTLEGKATR